MHLDIVLLDALALQYWTEINQGYDSKGDDGSHNAEDLLVFLKKCIFHGWSIVYFFKISVFSNVGIDVRIVGIIAIGLVFLLVELLHTAFQFLYFSLEYKSDNQTESIEKKNDDE